MNTSEAVDRLSSQLPLRRRQAELSPPLQSLHRAILHSLVERGRPLTRAEIRAQLSDIDVDTALERLVQDDLVVANAEQRDVVGAYPVTTEPTPHRIRVNNQNIYAMCALDALSVAPMFDAEVEVNSRCRLSNEPIYIHMRGTHILEARPSTDVCVGIRWQMPEGHAAHSMCMEMVFLKNEAAARAWQGDDTEHTSLFSLSEAVEFGAAFFLPLMEDAR